MNPGAKILTMMAMKPRLPHKVERLRSLQLANVQLVARPECGSQYCSSVQFVTTLWGCSQLLVIVRFASSTLLEIMHPIAMPIDCWKLTFQCGEVDDGKY